MTMLSSLIRNLTIILLQSFLSSRKEKRFGYLLPMVFLLLAVLRQLSQPSFLGYIFVFDLLFPAFLWLEYIVVSVFVVKREPKWVSKKLLAAIALSFVLLLSGVYLYGMFSVIKAHQMIIKQAQSYPEKEITSHDGKYLLKTRVTKEESGTYATFSIFDPVSGEELYQCPKHYRTMDLKKIDWMDDASYTIEISSGDIGTEHYYFDANTWEPEEKKVINNE